VSENNLEFISVLAQERLVRRPVSLPSQQEKSYSLTKKNPSMAKYHIWEIITTGNLLTTLF